MLVYVQGSIRTQEEEEHAGINTRLSSSSCSYRGNLQVACCCNWNLNLNAACKMRPLANHNTPNSMIMVDDSPLTPTRILVCLVRIRVQLGSDPGPAWFASECPWFGSRFQNPKRRRRPCGHGQKHNYNNIYNL